MNKFLIFLLTGVLSTSWASDSALVQQTQLSEEVKPQSAADIPTEEQRSEERSRLSRERQSLEDQYKRDMQQCYQKFDVTSCRLKARDRRIEANAVLRKDELRFNAQERQLHMIEVRRNLAERNSEAQQKNSEAERAAAIAASKERADANAQKQIDHALQGSKRGDFEQKQREAAQRREDAAQKIRSRKGEPAAPLPAPGK
jgi:hypothetical protein